MPGKARKMAAGAAAIVLLTAGCSSSSSGDTGNDSNTITIGISEPEHLIPTNETDANGSQVLSSLFYPLVKFDSTGTPSPLAATSITHDKANKVWTIKLKPGLTFSNGEAVTADDYIDAWNYGAYGPNGQLAGSFFARIKGYAAVAPEDPDGDGPQKTPKPTATTLSGLKKLDDSTIQVTLSEGFSGWETVMGYDAFYPLPQAAWDTPGVKIKAGFEDEIVGDGPFKMKGKWEHDQQIQVEKVPNFIGQVPKVDGITWKIYQDLGAAYNDLVANNLDVDTTIPVENLGSASSDLGSRLQKSPSSSFSFVGFPTWTAEYHDVRVRHAISMAINRQEMTDQIFLGSQTPATSFVSPVVAGAELAPDACGKWCDYNPSAARTLYEQANGPKTIKITYNVDGGHKVWVDAMCNQIKASLAIDCVGQGEPTLADVLKKVQNHEDVGLIRLGWIMDYPLMEDYLEPLYSTDGSSNYYGYSNPQFDQLVNEGSAAATPTEAEAKWTQAEGLLAKDMPVIPLRFGQNVFGHSTRVTNVSMDLYQKVDIFDIELAN